MPNRILRDGILRSPQVARLGWAEPSSLTTVEQVLAVRHALPKVKAGDPLQGYKWALSCRLRAIRAKAAGTIPPSVVRRLIEDAGDVCQECSGAMGHGAKRSPSIDHVTSLAKGGTSAPGNLRVICNRCNSKKADRA